MGLQTVSEGCHLGFDGNGLGAGDHFEKLPKSTGSCGQGKTAYPWVCVRTPKIRKRVVLNPKP